MTVSPLRSASGREPDRVNRPVATFEALDARLRWLSSWMIHHANNIRPNRDGLKVGGHQASCASMSTIMSTLYFGALRSNDRVAVKPHASPVLHAIEYLCGRQSRDQLERFRSLGGAQSYPSRTKDRIDVDFSTGSVGLGVAITAFASLTQDYLKAHGWLDPAREGRMIALLGDAELDEGNIYEALIEAYKHDIRNTWWIVDYNRQSLDATTADRMFDRFEDIFQTAGWRVLTLKYGKKQQQAFAEPGGEELRDWIDSCSNADYAALTYQGGDAWRKRLEVDLGAAGRALIARESDDDLHALMTGLGGHCVETLLDAFAEAGADDCPTLFTAYTIKGYGLPFQGHKDNHAGLMTSAQIEALRASLGIAAGAEWDPFAGLSTKESEAARNLIDASPFAHRPRAETPAHIDVPDAATFPMPASEEMSTQAGFGRILVDLAKSHEDLARRIVTTSPDVTVSTNLGGFVNLRGLFRRRAMRDTFRDAKIPSMQKWSGDTAGQHIELGIAESNLFLTLGALGLAGDIWGERLLPVGTLYDPFIARGLDSLNYACYQGARFMLVATPSGITLAPEGGAHQSISSPLIGMGQPGLAYFEPAYVDELSAIMRWGFSHMQADDGGSVYLRLSTRVIEQLPRKLSEAQAEEVIAGAYWLRRPEGSTPLAIAYTGAVAPEVMTALAQLAGRYRGLGVLAITSPDRLYADWQDARRASANGEPRLSHVERLLADLAPDAGIVTVVDGHPLTLSWLGSVQRNPVHPLGVTRFGESGDLSDLYAKHQLDADSIIAASATAANWLQPRRRM
ncbi:MAG TPA: transketolase [Hyphomonadaceae bacterium]|nr:transketolase [Hyphomonadaceae bacterium]HPN04199.1 transketolase [Hyphomonadaceae bacterium]